MQKEGFLTKWLIYRIWGFTVLRHESRRKEIQHSGNNLRKNKDLPFVIFSTENPYSKPIFKFSAAHFRSN